MNPLLSAMSRYYRRCRPASGKPRKLHRKTRRPRICLEVLEDRLLLTGPAPVSTVDGLVAAIDAANGSGQPTTITLATRGTFNLTTANNKTDGVNGLPVITGDITIEGNGSALNNNVNVPLANMFRCFDVASGASLTLDNLDLTGGRAYGSGVSAEGGAIYNKGNLSLEGVTIAGCWAEGNQSNLGYDGKNGEDAKGGGIYNAGGSVNLTDDTLDGNAVLGGLGDHGVISKPGGNGGSGSGGGLYTSGGSVILVNDKVTSNAAWGGQGWVGGYGATHAPIGAGGNGSTGGNGGNGSGGGLYVGGGSVSPSYAPRRKIVDFVGRLSP